MLFQKFNQEIKSSSSRLHYQYFQSPNWGYLSIEPAKTQIKSFLEEKWFSHYFFSEPMEEKCFLGRLKLHGFHNNVVWGSKNHKYHNMWKSSKMHLILSFFQNVQRRWILISKDKTQFAAQDWIMMWCCHGNSEREKTRKPLDSPNGGKTHPFSTGASSCSVW